MGDFGAGRGAHLVALISALLLAASPALGELQPLLGTWQCSGTQRLEPSAKASPTAGLWSFSRDLDGTWIAVRQDHERTPEDPHPLRAHGYLGYSEGQQRFVLWLATNDGLSEQQGAAGFEGGRLVFNGQLRDGDQTVNFRRTFEVRSRALKISFELELAEKQWALVASESCSR